MDRLDSALARNVLGTLVSLRSLFETQELGVSPNLPDVHMHVRILHSLLRESCDHASSLVGLLSLEEAQTNE